MIDFNQLRTTKKGNAGEGIALRYLTKADVKVYTSQMAPHCIDFLGLHNGYAYGIEVKTYPRRYGSATTGMDKKDFVTYQSLAATARIEIVVLFVDAFEGFIYGARLSVLRDVATYQGDKVYFPLEVMQLFAALTAADMEQIKGYSIRDSRYRNVKRYYAGARNLLAAGSLTKRWQQIIQARGRGV